MTWEVAVCQECATDPCVKNGVTFGLFVTFFNFFFGLLNCWRCVWDQDDWLVKELRTEGAGGKPTVSRSFHQGTPV